MNDRARSNELDSSCHVDERRLVFPTIKVFCDPKRQFPFVLRDREDPCVAAVDSLTS